MGNWKIENKGLLLLLLTCCQARGKSRDSNSGQILTGFEARGVLPRILDRGMPRRFLNPNPI